MRQVSHSECLEGFLGIVLSFPALNESQSVMFLDAGEMPERSKGAVLKTAERKFRGFESLSLRWLCSRFARTG